ncbi:hypothetical protein [Bradyrhizobium iriomotense]|uniref:Uncharacterized protein n=1 Tax=Bradyrhizobium iriomotense TaxID=441950 RepID=A0ABQ6BAN0_9BRAD|nr:hypothetical protein [Bradyrhizobium iriomotense]GLR91437.1 hypothetical protein GCM10007857_81540 [Bradyrhizobium iriomotense]
MTAWYAPDIGHKVPEPKFEDLNRVDVGAYVLKGGRDVSTSLPSDATVEIKKVGVSIARKACGKQFDTIAINVPAAYQKLSQTWPVPGDTLERTVERKETAVVYPAVYQPINFAVGTQLALLGTPSSSRASVMEGRTGRVTAR